MKIALPDHPRHNSCMNSILLLINGFPACLIGNVKQVPTLIGSSKCLLHLSAYDVMGIESPGQLAVNAAGYGRKNECCLRNDLSYRTPHS